MEMDDQSDVSEYVFEGGEDTSSKHSRGRDNGQTAAGNGGGYNAGYGNITPGEPAEEDYDAPEDEEYAY